MLLLSLGACGEDPVAFDVDLSRSHAPRDVDWPDLSSSYVQVEPISSLRVGLPGGVVFTPGTAIDCVLMNRDGEDVTSIQINAEKASPGAAYALAKRWAEQFALNTRGLDEWYANRRRGGDPLERAQASAAEPLGGEDGPIPIVRIEYSADDELPSVATLELQWTRDPGGRPAL